MKVLLGISACFSLATGLLIPPDKVHQNLAPRTTGCENTATSRSCWGEYDVNTDYYDVIPDTGVTREVRCSSPTRWRRADSEAQFWLVAQNIMAALDGYQRQVLAFNGTVPGPALEFDWGDNVIVHVKNDIADNGTSVHWHGIRYSTDSKWSLQEESEANVNVL